MIANRGKMAFYFLKVMPRAASEVQVLSGNGQFSGSKNPSNQKYINYKDLSSLEKASSLPSAGRFLHKMCTLPVNQKKI
jgi:hypothetical protein